MADIRYRAIANTPRIGVPPTIIIFQNSAYRRAEQVNAKHLGGRRLPFEAKEHLDNKSWFLLKGNSRHKQQDMWSDRNATGKRTHACPLDKGPPVGWCARRVKYDPR
jgi:hypothetical protein